MAKMTITIGLIKLKFMMLTLGDNCTFLEHRGPQNNI